METTTDYIIQFLIKTRLKYKITPVDAAVDIPSTAVYYAVDQSIPRGSIRKTKYHFLFSAFLRITPRKDLASKTYILFSKILVNSHQNSALALRKINT